VRRIVVAAEPVTSLDVTAADVVAELDETLHEAGIELYIAEMTDPVKDKLRRFGLFARRGEETLFRAERLGRWPYGPVHENRFVRQRPDAGRKLPLATSAPG
jgi:MFS superfamily sulfate permease-like transporter